MTSQNASGFCPRRRARHASGLAFLAASATLCMGTVAHAQPAFVSPGGQPGDYTWGELALLPDYCKDVQGVFGQTTVRYAYWASPAVIGPDFNHFHHYCRALNLTRRASQPGVSPTQKSVWELKSISDYEYMVGVASPNNILMPEILLQYGDLMYSRGEKMRANDLWAKSRKLKPDYWPAYTRWIDELMKLKLNNEAMALAQEGLRYAPDSVELQERATRLQNAGTAQSQGARRPPAAEASPKGGKAAAAGR